MSTSEIKYRAFETGSGKWLKYTGGEVYQFHSTRENGTLYTREEFDHIVMTHKTLGSYTTWELQIDQ